MRKRYIAATALAVVALIGIASCHSGNSEYAQAPVAAQVVQAPVQQQPVYVQAPPVVVQQSNDGFVTGMLMGHLMSGGSHTTVVHHYAPAPVIRSTTVINKTVNVTRVTPTYRPSGYSAYRSSGFGRRR